jgi:hypothetical protein
MYLVDGQRYGPDGHGLERALAAAYDDRIRPLCLCCDPPISVYITRLGETFVLKRMPFTGSKHAVGCPHYEPPAELSGLGEVLGTAISEDPDTGVTHLRVGFSLSKGAPRAVVSGTGQDRGSVRSDGTRLSLRGLLHFLWHEAELTRWQAGFAGRRPWAVVRSHLLAAATRMNLRGAPLSDALYVPEAFSVAKRDEISARRMRRLANGLHRRGNAQPLMVLIGEVKEIVPTRFHFKAMIKHAPDQAFLLDSQLHRRMVTHLERELSLWSASEALRMMLVATFGLNQSGLPSIEELALMPVTSHWIPIEDSFDLQLVDRLVFDRRSFVKPLGNTLTGAKLAASAILLDTVDPPSVLRVDRSEVASPLSVATGGALLGVNALLWNWRAGQEPMPALPPLRDDARPHPCQAGHRVYHPVDTAGVMSTKT